MAADDPVGAAISGAGQHCWEIVKSSGQLCGTCEECYAYYVQRDCWVLWALREPGHKPCCQKVPDCGSCPVLLERLKPQLGEAIQIRARAPSRAPLFGGQAKKVCQYLDVIGLTASAEDERAQSTVQALQTRSSVMRCRLRGVYLDHDYVSDVCVSAHPEQCVFLDDAQPQVRITSPASIVSVPVAKQALEKRPPGKRALAKKYPADGSADLLSEGSSSIKGGAER